MMSVELPVIDPKLVLGTIHPSTGEITVSDKPIAFNCSLSTDCCGNKNFQVPINDMDIERIEEHGYEIDQIVAILSPEIRFASDNTAEKNYWIKRKPFTGKCTFLKDNLCSIHEFKPFACRIFPFQLLGRERGGYTVAVHKSKLCKSVREVTEDEAQNTELLEFILKEVQNEDRRRLIYFDKYGRN
ncbi:MAG: YkgJ family cysteine cluster protein [Candidatus Kariarchaeaceae archaeon]|jgi:Fe-S-cluster containining protein